MVFMKKSKQNQQTDYPAPSYEDYSYLMKIVHDCIIKDVEPILKHIGISYVDIRWSLNRRGNFLAEKGQYDPVIITILAKVEKSGYFRRLISDVPIEILDNFIENSKSSAAVEMINTIIHDIECFAYEVQNSEENL